MFFVMRFGLDDKRCLGGYFSEEFVKNINLSSRVIVFFVMRFGCRY